MFTALPWAARSTAQSRGWRQEALRAHNSHRCRLTAVDERCNEAPHAASLPGNWTEQSMQKQSSPPVIIRFNSCWQLLLRCRCESDATSASICIHRLQKLPSFNQYPGPSPDYFYFILFLFLKENNSPWTPTLYIPAVVVNGTLI